MKIKRTLMNAAKPISPNIHCGSGYMYRTTRNPLPHKNRQKEVIRRIAHLVKTLSFANRSYLTGSTFLKRTDNPNMINVFPTIKINHGESPSPRLRCPVSPPDAKDLIVIYAISSIKFATVNQYRM